jgi:F-type H+-transporting ATPase subunit a
MAFPSPIEQFEIHNFSPTLFSIAGHPVALTNSAICMMLAVILSTAFMTLTVRTKAVVPGRWQVLAEMFFNGIRSTVSEAAGAKAGAFFPFIFTIFLFIMFCNLLGMFPHVYTVTSQLIVNFVLALGVIVVVLTTGFIKHGPKFAKIFVPSGVPWFLLPVIVPIEMISFFIRPCSLSLRLFANMLAGHILMKVFAGMSSALAGSGWLVAVGVLPVIFNVTIVAFEFFVALLQAYIFSILSSVYLHDALEMH